MLDYVTTHDSGDFTRWSFDGANRANTDQGRVYVRVNESAGDTIVSLFSDPGRTALVAQGTLAGTSSGDLTLVEENSSGLSGSVRIHDAAPGEATLDVFYADDDDLTALQKDVGGFLDNGEFNSEPGFKDPLARAKRVMDALMNARFPEGWRADSLQPLADATARYALFFIYDHLSTRAGDPAGQLAAHWRREARAALAHIRVSIAGRVVSPFDARIVRA